MIGLRMTGVDQSAADVIRALAAEETETASPRGGVILAFLHLLCFSLI